MATSVVPDVMSELRTQLRARAGLAGVQVLNGLPWQPDRDFVAILDADPHEQEHAGMRRAISGGRHETFTLTVVVSALRKGDEDHSEVITRAYVLLDELENELDEDATINASLGAGGHARISGLPLNKPGPDKDGWREARITARVECQSID